MVLSAQFWPAFREEKITLPEMMQESLKEYTKKFEALKGNRTLNNLLVSSYLIGYYSP
jgi:anaphase-promoting complex subunit 2